MVLDFLKPKPEPSLSLPQSNIRFKDVEPLMSPAPPQFTPDPRQEDLLQRITRPDIPKPLEGVVDRPEIQDSRLTAPPPPQFTPDPRQFTPDPRLTAPPPPPPKRDLVERITRPDIPEPLEGVVDRSREIREQEKIEQERKRLDKLERERRLGTKTVRLESGERALVSDERELTPLQREVVGGIEGVTETPKDIITGFAGAGLEGIGFLAGLPGKAAEAIPEEAKKDIGKAAGVIEKTRDPFDLSDVRPTDLFTERETELETRVVDIGGEKALVGEEVPISLGEQARRNRAKEFAAINELRNKISGFILSSPETREIEDLTKEIDKSITSTDKEIKQHEKDVKKLENKIEKFNEKYGKDELSQEAFQKAQKEKEKLDKELAEIRERTEILETKRKEEVNLLSELDLKQRAEERRRKSDVSRITKGFAIGLAEVPLSTAEFAISPERAGKELVEGLTELPDVAGVDPFLTIGTLAGTAVGFAGTSAAIRGLSRAGRAAQNIKSRTGRSPELSHSFEVTDAVKIGENKYRVKSNTKTNIIDPKTKKVVDTIETTGTSDIVTSKTRSGAIKAAVESYSAAIGKRGQRISTKPIKVTKKFNLGAGKGEIIFKLKDSGKIKGVGFLQSADVGTLRLKAKPGELTIDPTFKILAPERISVARSVSELMGGKVPKTKALSSTQAATGLEQLFKSVTFTETAPRTVRVRGFTKKEGTRVPARLRRAKDPRKLKDPSIRIDEDLTKGFGSIFEPKKTIPNLKDPSKAIGIDDSLILRIKGFRRPDGTRVPAKKFRRTKKPSERIDVEFLENLMDSDSLIPLVDIPKPKTPRKPSKTTGRKTTETRNQVQELILGEETQKQIAQATAQAGQEALIRTTTPKIRTTKPRTAKASSITAQQLDRLTEGVTTAVSAKEAQRESQRIKQEEKALEKQRAKQAALTSQTIANLVGQSTIQDITQAQKQTSRITQKTTTKLKPVSETETIITTTPTIRPPREPGRIKDPKKPPRPPRIIFDTDKDDLLSGKKPDKGYHVQIKERGKWRKVTKEPIARQKALDKGAFLSDQALGAQFRVKKTKKKPKEPQTNIPPRYFDINKWKFRDYRVIKGERKPLKEGKYIERSPHRLDSRGEVKGITTSRLLSQRRQKAKQKRKTSEQIDKGFSDAFGFGTKGKSLKRQETSIDIKQYNKNLEKVFNIN